ncbi:MAG: zeta toxin family protein [Bryobacterales bacterium]|nr:zeta toxin family protein [Acidobacteriota bacterium]MCB9383043.1 zeta toxin family protein [Bryobacterales bacterium]
MSSSTARPELPVLTVVAGPNGSGKSSLSAVFAAGDPIVDPDAIARELNPAAPERASIAAARAAIGRSRSLLEMRRNFVVETTLAGVGPVALMRDARERGFRIRLVFVCLSTPELNIERVRERVLQGGHDVPVEDIRRRYSRSLENASVAASLAEEALLVDNSFTPATVASVRAGRVIWQANPMPEWAQSILARLG